MESILTTDGHRFVDIPTILELVCRKHALGKMDNSATNRDVEESPLRYTRSRRDRVRKAIKPIASMSTR